MKKPTRTYWSEGATVYATQPNSLLHEIVVRYGSDIDGVAKAKALAARFNADETLRTS